MCRLLHSKVFRVLVCLILVAAFLLNLSPLNANATAVAGTMLSFEGLMAVLYSMGIGIVATELTVEAWNKIGQGLGQEIENADPSVLEAWVDVEALYNSYGPDDDDPEDALEWADKLKHALSRGLLAAIAGWLCSVVKMGGYEVEGNTVLDGYAFYNDTLLPEYVSNDGYPYHLIVFNPGAGPAYQLFQSSVPFLYNGSKFTNSSEESFVYATCLTPYQKWGSKFYGPHNWTSLADCQFIWSNYTITSTDGVHIAFEGSEPRYKYSEVIEPSIYVGDIPQQIQDGDKDEDDLVLPVIDPFRVIQSPGTALDDINQLQQQLANGTTTLDQYLEQVTYQDPSTDPVNPDPSSPSDPSDSTTPSTGTDEEWQPPTDPTGFALDLTKVFPFCIPFDLYAFLTCLNADPVTPVIEWEIAMPGGGSYPLTIDLSPFDSVAQLLRRLELLLFIIALAIKTRDLIKG